MRQQPRRTSCHTEFDERPNAPLPSSRFRRSNFGGLCLSIASRRPQSPPLFSGKYARAYQGVVPQQHASLLF